MGFKFFLALCSFFWLFNTGAAANPNLVLGTGLSPPLVAGKSGPGFLDSILQKAFRRMEMDVKILVLPAERVLVNANKGIEDGCVLRIKGLEKKYPNLVRVPEMMMYSEFVGYAKAAAPIAGGNWEALAPYSVAYITGWKIFDINLTGHPRLVKVKTPAQLFTLLQQGRADIVLYERWQGLGLLQQFGIRDAAPIQPPFAKFEMFMYLNKRHKNLVPELAAVLAGLKGDGTYQQLYDIHLHALAAKD